MGSCRLVAKQWEHEGKIEEFGTRRYFSKARTSIFVDVTDGLKRYETRKKVHIVNKRYETGIKGTRLE